MDIIDVFMTKCSCMTKTPELAFHKEDCKFRVAWGAYYTKKDSLDRELDKLVADSLTDLYEE